MNPNPLDTSNHLMTPLSSMTLVVSSAISPTASRTRPIPVPDPFGPISSDVMAPHARRCPAPRERRAPNLHAPTIALRRVRETLYWIEAIGPVYNVSANNVPVDIVGLQE